MVLRALGFAWALALPLAAGAAPITYAFTSGSASLSLKLNGYVVASASAPLDGMSLTFDAAAQAITDLDLLLTDQVSFPMLLGRDTLSFSIQAVDGPGYSSSGSGSNPYSVTSGPLTITFTGVIFDSGGAPPPNIVISSSLTTGPVGSTVTVAGNDLTAVFASTKMLQHGWQTIELWVAVTFQGTAVPEPSLALLLAAGAAALSLRASRRLRS